MRAQLFCFAVLVLTIKGINSAVVPTTAATLRACSPQCACSVLEDRKLVTMQCAGQNFSTVPTSDANMEIVAQLDISDNAIELIPNEAFKEYPNVEKIDASQNKISTIELCAFFGVDFIQAVDLSENIIMYIHPDTFSANPYLKVIDLSNNPLTKVSTNVPILNIPMVTTLDISYCQLPSLSSDMFKGMPALETLDISNNDISYFPLVTLEGLDSLVDIKLDNNRWSCDDCNLLRTLNALELRRPGVEDELSCLDSNGSFKEISIVKESYSCDEVLLLDGTVLFDYNITSTDNDITETFEVERRAYVDDDLWAYLQHHSHLVQTLVLASLMLLVIFISAVLCVMCVMKRTTQCSVNAQHEVLTKNLQLAYSEPDRKRGSLVPLLEASSQDDSTPAPTQAGDPPSSLYEEYLMTRPNSEHLYFNIQ